MDSIIEKSKCCGCGACEQICPVKCIEMVEDEEGFLYPVIDKEKCIDCRKCENICTGKKIRIDHKERLDEVIGYGGWNNNDSVRESSSSGGIFGLLASYVISNGGIVYGCALNDEQDAIHIGVENENDLNRLYGSKYVQSNICRTFIETKKTVESGRDVLFVGTPCQVSALYSFLGEKEYSNLIIVSFICHGVSSPKVFKEYISKLETEQNSKVTVYKFRNKDRGWNPSGLQLGPYVEFKNGFNRRLYPAFNDTYMNGFLTDIMLRPSCYNCQYKGIEKNCSDIIIGDFWGVKKIEPSLYDGKGTSLILVTTNKGKNLWEIIRREGYFKEIDVKKAISHNVAFSNSAICTMRRESFFKDYKLKGYDYVEKEYMSKFNWICYKIDRIILRLLGKGIQFAKFGIVGIFNTILSLAIYYFGLWIGLNYILSYSIGFIVSTCNSFYWNGKYVFTNKKENSFTRSFIKVFLSYIVSYVSSIVIMSFLVGILGVSDFVAPILKIIIVFPINFVLNKFWAFRDVS